MNDPTIHPTAATSDSRIEDPWLVGGLIVLGTILRIYYAGASYLNPDEAMHYLAAAEESWKSAYAASQHQAHPPLLVLITHAVLFLGSSQWVLRLPSILVGAISLRLLYGWMRTLIGPSAAIFGLAFLAVSPAMIATASELRHSAWLLLFTSAALATSSRLASATSTRPLVLYSLLLCGALLSHYSAAWIVATLAIYVPFLLVANGASTRIIGSWALWQIPVGVVGYWSYFVHGVQWSQSRLPETVKTATTSARTGAARFDYLEPTLHTPAKESLAGFTTGNFLDLWQYLCGSRLLAIAVLILLATALVVGLRRRIRWIDTMLFASLVATPFVLGAVAGMLRLYPFGGTRHSAYLLPFAAAAIGMAAGVLIRRPRIQLVTIAMMSGLWIVTTVPANDPSVMPKSNVERALAYVESRPRDSVLLVDFQTENILRYYWRERGLRPRRAKNTILLQLEEGTRPIYATPWGVWAFSDGNVRSALILGVRAAEARAGQEIWMMSTGWPKGSIVHSLPGALTFDLKQFGQIWVLRVTLPDDLSRLLPTKVENPKAAPPASGRPSTGP